jgi:hypothetical protein
MFSIGCIELHACLPGRQEDFWENRASNPQIHADYLRIRTSKSQILSKDSFFTDVFVENVMFGLKSTPFSVLSALFWGHESYNYQEKTKSCNTNIKNFHLLLHSDALPRLQWPRPGNVGHQ